MSATWMTPSFFLDPSVKHWDDKKWGYLDTPIDLSFQRVTLESRNFIK
ncbi:MAG: hypothetical protein LBU56_01260 [Rickettsiales bacterium]|nr:hypothetical protein [Rickettsiales bacterium]